MDNERVAQMASLQLAYDHAIRDQPFERFEIDPQAADGRSHRAERNAVGAAILEAFQQGGKLLHLGGDFPGTLGVIGWRRSSEQGRRGRNNPLGLSRHFLQGQCRGDPPRRDAIENVADIAEGEDRDARTDHREAADPEERQQQSACHAEPQRCPCPHFRAVGCRGCRARPHQAHVCALPPTARRMPSAIIPRTGTAARAH